MKRSILILVILIIVLISYLNIKEPTIKETDITAPKESEEKKELKKSATEEDENEQALFPEVYEISNLTVDKKLPIVRFTNLSDTTVIDSGSIDITVEIPEDVKRSDLFLFVEKVKKDMYYQVEPGTYSFNDIKIKPGENLVELFYRKGNRRSQSVYSVVIKK